MGIVWEASHKGVPLLGVPGITLELNITKLKGLLGVLGTMNQRFTKIAILLGAIPQ